MYFSKRYNNRELNVDFKMPTKCETRDCSLKISNFKFYEKVSKKKSMQII